LKFVYRHLTLTFKDEDEDEDEAGECSSSDIFKLSARELKL